MSKSASITEFPFSKPAGFGSLGEFVCGVRCGISISSVGFAMLWFTGFCMLSGCQLQGGFNVWPQRIVPQQCALPPDMTKADVIQHLNQNVSKLNSWRSTHVQISTAGMPIKLKAVIAVEKPRNFRLRAGIVTYNEADFGSNPDRFWFWMRRSPDKYVLTSSHADSGQVQQMMKLPFEPNWLMEALGVTSLDESEFTMLPAGEADGLMSLIADRTTEAGETVRRVIQVDTCQGYIVAHELYDAHNRLIARAELNDYKLDRESGVTLPHRINLDWPQAQLAMTMTIGAIEVNPPHIPEQTWKVPEIPGYPVLDLGRITRRAQPAGRARVSAGNLNDNARPRDVRQTTWDEQSRDSLPLDVGQPVQTAEVPPWETDADTEGWHPPGQQPTHGKSVPLVADDTNSEPPWDEGEGVASNALPVAMPVHGGRNRIRGTAADASENEEPPWDQSSVRPMTRRNAKPASVLDFIKAPFANLLRR